MSERLHFWSRSESIIYLSHSTKPGSDISYILRSWEVQDVVNKLLSWFDASVRYLESKIFHRGLGKLEFFGVEDDSLAGALFKKCTDLIKVSLNI